MQPTVGLKSGRKAAPHVQICVTESNASWAFRCSVLSASTLFKIRVSIWSWSMCSILSICLKHRSSFSPVCSIITSLLDSSKASELLRKLVPSHACKINRLSSFNFSYSFFELESGDSWTLNKFCTRLSKIFRSFDCMNCRKPTFEWHCENAGKKKKRKLIKVNVFLVI